MLRVGTILHGTYRIDSFLSSGGFGNTYVATHIEFNERYAIKEFFMKGVTQRDGNQTTVSISNVENLDSFNAQREKFKKEARRLYQLSNPHIVRVYNLFEENGTAYYVMDYVDGEDLSERLKRTGKPMSEQEVRNILPQILDALKSIHDAGMWHLDLKPANIMLDKNGNIKLIDFGASKQMDAQKGGATASTAISHTTGYAPREQMEQNYDKFGPWTDIYALGATLYNLLTNKRPPLPTDIDDDMSEDKHLTLPMANVSYDMKKLILSMMQTNRMRRPQSIWNIQIPKQYVESSIQFAPISNPQKVDKEKTVTANEEVTIIENKKTIPDKNYQKQQPTSSDSEPTVNGNVKVLVILAGIVLFCLFIAIISSSQNSNTTSNTYAYETAVDTVAADTASYIDNYMTPIGVCRYKGGVDSNDRPDGYGEAHFEDGRDYEGNFSHGNLDGYCNSFRYGNGDTFVGEFKNNSFYEGTYTIAKDGSYFVGTYRNGKPYKGTWYNKNGNVIQ